MTEPLALSVGQPTNLGQELPAPHEKKPEEDGEDTNSEDSSEGSMVDGPSVGSHLTEVVTPVLNVRDIMNIVENKEISIKTPRLNHNLQRAGLDDNLFDFGNAL